MFAATTPLQLILGVVLLWFTLGVIGVLFPRNLALVSRALFPAGALAIAAAALSALAGDVQSLILSLGLPDLPFHLRLDPLSAFFLLLLGATAAGISVFAAGYLYILIAHIGALGILLCFGVLHGSGDYSFDSMREAQFEPFWATAAFALALVGFGAKAGIIPLHVWLPEAHPAVPGCPPTPIALMQGILTAISGGKNERIRE